MRKIIKRSWISALLVVVLFSTACGKVAFEQAADDAKQQVLKLPVTEAGVYHLKRADLEKFGFSIDDLNSLALTLRGEAVPLWQGSENSKDDLLFYGIPAENSYSLANIYWLSTGNQMVERRFISEQEASANLHEKSDVYQARLELEQNMVYSPQATGGEHWFWVNLPAPRQHLVEVELNAVGDGSGTLRVVVWGSTQSPSEFDHHLRLFVNDVKVLDEFWDGTGWKTLEGEVPAGVFYSSKNTILIDSPGDSGAAADLVWLDGIELTYARRAEAEGERLVFDGEGKILNLTGFNGAIDVLDITDPFLPILLTGLEPDGNTYGVPAQAGRRYIAVGEQGIMDAQLQLPASTPDLRSELAGANYIAIGPTELLEPLTDLLVQRQSEGLSVITIPLVAIYDQFNQGFPEPEAVRSFLRFAEENWNTKPQYLLLVGDATYDPLGYITPSEANRLPVFFTSTTFGGQTSSDLPYADLDEDGKPDIAIGRIPAQTVEQVSNWVEKTLAYEAATGEWQRQVLAIADGQEASFQADAQDFLDRVKDGFHGELFAPSAGSKDAATQINDYFENGFGLVGYFGHGSLNMWGRDRLFTVEDVLNLSNEKLPIVLTITCLNGYFIHPTTTSLAEALLWQPNSGAVAVLAPTSLTLAMDQAVLGREFYARLASQSGRLGDILLQAQRAVPGTTQGQQEVLQTFLLFGDPALKIGGK